MKVVAYTHQGPSPKYDHNEDSIAINDRDFSNGDFTFSKSYLFKHEGSFAVSDGVGGSFGGEIASSALVKAFIKFVGAQKVISEADVESLLFELKEAVDATHIEYECDEMMCTFVSVIVNKNNLIFLNIGDSPSFIFRNNKLQMMSTLDTYANKLLKDGMSLEEVSKIDTAHCITACFGLKSMSIYSVHTLMDKPEKGDKYLLMSDGIYDYIQEAELETLLINNKDINKFAKEIERIVLERGAHDNYSLVVIEY